MADESANGSSEAPAGLGRGGSAARRARARVYAPREDRAGGDVAYEPYPYGLFELLTYGLGPVLLGKSMVRLVFNVPVLLHRKLPARARGEPEEVTGRQLTDALEYRARERHVVVREVIGHGHRVELSGHAAVLEYRLELRCE